MCESTDLPQPPSVLQCGAVCCSVFQHTALWCVVVRCSAFGALQCVAVRCRAMQCVAHLQQPHRPAPPATPHALSEFPCAPTSRAPQAARYMWRMPVDFAPFGARWGRAGGRNTHASIETTISLPRPLKETSEKDMRKRSMKETYERDLWKKLMKETYETDTKERLRQRAKCLCVAVCCLCVAVCCLCAVWCAVRTRWSDRHTHIHIHTHTHTHTHCTTLYHEKEESTNNERDQWKGPMKETYERDLWKRCMKETYERVVLTQCATPMKAPQRLGVKRASKETHILQKKPKYIKRDLENRPMEETYLRERVVLM